MMEQKTQSKDGKKFLMILLAFFLVMCSANAVFIYFALNTYAGTVTDRPYEKGLEYNKVIKAAQAQKDLGVVSEFRYENGHYTVSLQTKDGAPIDDATISAKMVRSIKMGSDFETELKPEGHGVYGTKLTFPHAGLWIAKTQIVWNQTTFLRSDKMIVEK